MALLLRQITDALKISRARVEQWISRGHFRTPDKPIFGHARDWSIDDAIRLSLFINLVDAAISVEQAGVFTQIDLHGFKDDVAFFVAWQGAMPLLSAKGPLNLRKKISDSQKARMPGMWGCKIVRGRDLLVFLEHDDVDVAVVINLDNLEKRVKQALNHP